MRGFPDMQQTLTFIYRDNVWVAEWRHDLNLSANVHHVLLVLDLLFPNGFNSHLKTNKKKTLLWQLESECFFILTSATALDFTPLVYVIKVNTRMLGLTEGINSFISFGENILFTKITKTANKFI